MTDYRMDTLSFVYNTFGKNPPSIKTVIYLTWSIPNWIEKIQFYLSLSLSLSLTHSLFLYLSHTLYFSISLSPSNFFSSYCVSIDVFVVNYYYFVFLIMTLCLYYYFLIDSKHFHDEIRNNMYIYCIYPWWKSIHGEQTPKLVSL